MNVKSNSLVLIAFSIFISCHSLAQEKCLNVIKTFQSVKKDLRIVDDNVDDIYKPSKKELRITGESILLSIDNYYGPKKHKIKAIGFDWKKKKTEFMNRLMEVSTNAEALLVVADFLHQLDDAHVSIQLPSTYVASIPLQLSYVPETNSIHVNQINHLALVLQIKSGPAPELGSKLTKINDIDIFEFQKKYPFFSSSNGNPLTNASMFARAISYLSEASGFPLSLFKSMVWKFEFESPTTRELSTVEIEYKTEGTPLITGATVLKTRVANLDTQLQDRIIDSEITSTGKKYRIGQSQSFFELPSSFQKIKLPDHLKDLFSENRLHAGVFRHEGKNVGYLRIASYNTSGYKLEDIAQVLDYYINQLESRSDYLLIDQMSNPGGSVTYSDMIVERLVGEIDPKIHMKFKVKPTHSWMQGFTSFIEEVAKDYELQQVDPERHKNLIEFLKTQFEIVHRAYMNGEPYSEPISLLGYHEYVKFKIDQEQKNNSSGQFHLFDPTTDSLQIQSTRPRYSKKIYMFVDHYSFSCGDATPANLKDYKRAILIGTRTAGAGGNVESVSSRLLKSEFSYSLTMSLMYRPQGDETYVENYGVTPHYTVNPTLKDYLNGFQDYFRQVLKIISEDQKKKP